MSEMHRFLRKQRDFLKFKIFKNSKTSVEHILCAMPYSGHLVGTRRHSMVGHCLVRPYLGKRVSLILESCSGFISHRPNHSLLCAVHPFTVSPVAMGGHWGHQLVGTAQDALSSWFRLQLVVRASVPELWACGGHRSQYLFRRSLKSLVPLALC